jgi:hypothetical protein
VKRVLDLFPDEPIEYMASQSPRETLFLEEHPKTHALFTSWDEGRIIGTTTSTLYVNANTKTEISKTKTKNDSQTDNNNDLTNDTSEAYIYLESFHFSAHTLEHCPLIQDCFMYTRAPTLNAQRWRPYLAYRPVEVIQRTL